ncbi:MAG: Na+/H+ antiporter [Chloroflexota bacterium]|nr:MAG: Na+/H+ antiporter [Chloroflexota bacterium]
MEEILSTQTIVVLLVVVATLVAIIGRRIRLPYTVSLVLVGLLISIKRPLDVEITPELIMSIFVPLLLFEAAFHVDFRMLRENLTSIIVLAVPGVILVTMLVGGIVYLGTGLALGVTFVFGALIAATDPVAVVALFRTLGVPHRLAVAVEGESLFNDGTAIVVFQIALVAALSGVFNPLTGIFDFFRIAVGGMVIGLALGWLVAQLISRVDDSLIVTTLTTLLAYGAYLSAEQFHVSGVLAVVVAGLVSGNVGLAGASPTTKIMLFNLWEYLAFLANSLVFLLIGLSVDLPQLWENRLAIGVAVLAVLASRAVVVYGISWFGKRRFQMPVEWQHVLFWGGLRGAISLAMALSLPLALPHREMLQSMTFGVVLFTLLIQGTTIKALLQRLGLTERPQHQIEREVRLGRLVATQAGLRELERLHHDGLLTAEIWAGMRNSYIQDQKLLVKEMNQLFLDHAELEREMVLKARQEALRAEHVALSDALRRGLISGHVNEKLTTDIDHRLEALDIILASVQNGHAAQEEG